MKTSPSDALIGAPKQQIESIGVGVRDEFLKNRRVMSFDEYFALFARDPGRHSRSAARYTRDVLDHFGADEVRSPAGPIRRFRIFDGVPSGDDTARGERAAVRLAGHEEAQNAFYRILANFVREGRANKLVLLHGPNGSAKSTFVECVAAALERYSQSEEGALYRFNWIFPSDKYSKSGMGFGAAMSASGGGGETYAYLGDDLIDARLRCDLRDHPLFLVPASRRRAILAERLRAAGEASPVPNDYVWHGDLCVKCKQIYEALLTSYQGDYLKLLRHVQVERFYLSRRYREALVDVEPQLSVDAYSRQVTADRSLGHLPPTLQSLALHEFGGSLVEANRGLIVYSDLLKRPIEAYKYLLTTVEQARFGLEGGIVYLDAVLIASSNEAYLTVFKELPEFASFKGRIELVRVPYLLDYDVERQIYDDQTPPGTVGKHIAPHATLVAALWAVLTRMRKPLAEKYGKQLAELVPKLTPIHKADLYARGAIPPGIAGDAAADLRASVERIWRESETYPNYEGRTGASPREIKTVLLNAAQRAGFSCLSAPAVLEELDDLCKNASVYEFLKQEPLPGGFHENRKFVDVARDRWLDLVDDAVRASMGLVEEAQHQAHFARYVQQVSHWVRNEKVRNPVTGSYEEADEDLMSEVERALGVGPKKNDFRAQVIASVGAWVVDHPKQKPDFGAIFPQHLDRLRESYYEQARKTIQKTLEEVMTATSEGSPRLSKEAQKRVDTTLANLRDKHGYCDGCAKEAVTVLYRKRYL
ncbi:MAG: serine protein kinase PrkA [Myxococcota bacterium]